MTTSLIENSIPVTLAPFYLSFSQAQQQIKDCAPIDYFFAKDLCQAFSQEMSKTKQTFFDNGLYFHLFMALSESLSEGHSCLNLEHIAKTRWSFHSDDENVVSHHGYQFCSLDELLSAIELLNISPKAKQLIVYQNHCLYLRRYFTFEQQLSQYMSQRLIPQNFEQQNLEAIKRISVCLNSLFPPEPLNESQTEIDWQKVAVANAINKDFSIIAGGPGTGKTYTVIKLLAALLMLNEREETKLRIALVAPTGKAAQRLSTSISQAIKGFRGKIADRLLDDLPVQAQTIHRLLGVKPNSANFRHNQDNLLAIDVLLIDEVSMVDLALMTRVFRALPSHCKVILLGDADQLPSVSAGSVLADIAQRPHLGFSQKNIDYLNQVTQYQGFAKAKKTVADHLVFLTKSRRFDGEGGIGLLAKAVIAGQNVESWQLLKDNIAQLQHLDSSQSSWLPAMVTKYYQPIFSCKTVIGAFEQLGEFRILCATKQGEQGVEHINEQVKLLLKAKGLINSTDKLFHAEPIMISENNYRLGLFNGDIGLIWRNDAGHLMAVFETSESNCQGEPIFKWIMPSRLPKYNTVFAMTIHKTQGSEFDHVLMVLPQKSDNKLLTRELLYTGLTRAKSMLSISTTKNIWYRGVEAQVKRYSGLKIG